MYNKKEKLWQEQQKMREFRRKVLENNNALMRYIVTDNNGNETTFDRKQMLVELDRPSSD